MATKKENFHKGCLGSDTIMLRDMVEPMRKRKLEKIYWTKNRNLLKMIKVIL